MRPDQDSSIKKIGIYMYNNIYLTLTCCLINVESMPCRKCNLGWTICMKDIIQYMYRLTGVFPKTQEDTHTLLFLHEERQLLLLSFNSLLLLLETMKEERRTSSHEHPVTCVLYNSLFRQVGRWLRLNHEFVFVYLYPDSRDVANWTRR